MTPANSPRLILVDGYGFVFRAYHSLPPLTRPDGVPVGAVYGFTNMLLKFLDSADSDYIAVVFDSGQKSFRNDIYSAYKANRPPAPEDLIPQFPLVREAAEALNIATVELQGFEADDLIATYTKLAHRQGMEVIIVSSDKDLMQLVGDGVTMLDPMKSKTIGVAEVKEKFGVAPDKVLDALSLIGDSSDNVPGVPSIGPKTAAELIVQFGSLDNILAHVDEIPQKKRKEVLKENAEQARLSRELIRLCDEVPPPIAVDAMAKQAINQEKLLAFLNYQGFKSLVTRIEKKFGVEPSASAAPVPVKNAKTQEERKVVIRDKATLEQWVQEATLAGQVAITWVTDPGKWENPLVGVALGVSAHAACYIPLGHRHPKMQQSLDFGDKKEEEEFLQGQLPLKEVLQQCKALLTDPAVLKISYNIKELVRMLGALGIEVSPVEDVMLMSYVLEAGLHDQALATLVERHLHLSFVTEKTKELPSHVAIEKMAEHLSADACRIMALEPILRQHVVQGHAMVVYERIERPLIPVLAQMETTGVKISRKELMALSQDFGKRLDMLEKEIHHLAGREFNVGSPKQLGEILFSEMKLGGTKKTKTGAFVTNAEVLEELAAEGHVLPEKVLEWRQLAKLKNTYTDVLQEEINPNTGRVHTRFAMAGATTGRLSSSDPNLQNIPIRTEEGNKIRHAFIAEEGNVLLSADYSQIELRLLAHMADIKALQDAFRHGLDIHAATASEMFGVPVEGMDPLIRRKAKAINFGIIYGISAFGLARQLGISRNDAAEYIAKYFHRYPGIKEYIERCHHFAREHGYVKTLFGRRCHIKEIHSKNPSLKNFSERVSVNAPLQGTGADIIKKAMVRLSAVLKEQCPKARIILQVHDELLLEVPEKEGSRIQAVVKKTMENVVSLKVPLLVATGVGNNWVEIH